MPIHSGDGKAHESTLSNDLQLLRIYYPNSIKKNLIHKIIYLKKGKSKSWHTQFLQVGLG